ncbi:MAG TPA: DUF4160 domain-containing protein [Pseudolabrys sp.]|nr:DUF4160 domain-containing protein [Pseudolabrys sp.]
MPVVAVLSNAKISVYGGWREHPPPHCHRKGPGSNCTIDLATLEIMRGRASRKDLEEAVAWLAKNAGAVWSLWRELNERE